MGGTNRPSHPSYKCEIQASPTSPGWRKPVISAQSPPVSFQSPRGGPRLRPPTRKAGTIHFSSEQENAAEFLPPGAPVRVGLALAGAGVYGQCVQATTQECSRIERPPPGAARSASRLSSLGAVASSVSATPTMHSHPWQNVPWVYR